MHLVAKRLVKYNISWVVERVVLLLHMKLLIIAIFKHERAVFKRVFSGAESLAVKIIS